MKKTAVLWILAILITISSLVYQRLTGPSYAVHGSIEIQGKEVDFTLPRSYETTADAKIEIENLDENISGEIQWKRYKSHDTLIIGPLQRDGQKLFTTLPRQPMAGKIIYQITLMDESGTKYNLTDKPIIIRFHGPVPGFILIPHIFFMFAGMLLAVRAGFEALARRKRIYSFTIWATAILFIGGLILGPLMQKYAFDTYWAGWPLGHDLTDNKTMAVLIFWAIALWRGSKEGRGRLWVIIASAVTLLVFLIPHSLLGSEIDYTKIDQG